MASLIPKRIIKEKIYSSRELNNELFQLEDDINASLQIVGDNLDILNADTYKRNMVTITSDHVATYAEDGTLFAANVSAGSINVQLPPSTGHTGLTYGIKSRNNDLLAATALFFVPDGTDQINNTVGPYGVWLNQNAVWIRAVGAVWRVIAESNMIDLSTVGGAIVERHANGVMHQRGISPVGIDASTASGALFVGDDAFSYEVPFIGPAPIGSAIVGATTRWANIRGTSLVTCTARHFATISSATVLQTRYNVSGRWRA